MGEPGLHVRGLESGRRRGDHGGRGSTALDHFVGRALDREVFRDGFLDVLGSLDRFFDRRGEAERAFVGRGEFESRPGFACPVEGPGDAVLGAGRLVEDRDVDAVQKEARGPGGADRAGADDRDALGRGGGRVGHQTCFVKPRRSRTSCGPITSMFMPDRIVVARSTSWAFVASSPRDR